MTTFDEKEIRLAANAIGWVFYGDQSEDGVMVEVSEEDSEKCVTAARRALTQIEQYRDIERNKALSDNAEASEYSDASSE